VNSCRQSPRSSLLAFCVDLLLQLVGVGLGVFLVLEALPGKDLEDGLGGFDPSEFFALFLGLGTGLVVFTQLRLVFIGRALFESTEVLLLDDLEVEADLGNVVAVVFFFLLFLVFLPALVVVVVVLAPQFFKVLAFEPGGRGGLTCGRAATNVEPAKRIKKVKAPRMRGIRLIFMLLILLPTANTVTVSGWVLQGIFPDVNSKGLNWGRYPLVPAYWKGLCRLFCPYVFPTSW
tara:strand:+ start:312 stop:1010 length:699 start_codon:yes stop_codon:yes gene_type:complete